MAKMRRLCLYVTHELGQVIDELASKDGAKLAEFVETVLRKSPKISKAAKTQGIKWPHRVKPGRPWPKKTDVSESENLVT